MSKKFDLVNVVLRFGGAGRKAGEVVEVSAEKAKALIDNGNATPAPAEKKSPKD